MILGLIEHDRGQLASTSLEMLALTQTLSMDVAAVIVGENGRHLTDLLPSAGVSRAYVVVHERLDDYAPEAWAAALIGVIETEHPDLVMAPGTDRGNELMAHIAARTGTSFAANCTAVEPGEATRVTRLRWGGSLLEEAQLTGQPKLLTIAPHVVPVENEPAATGTIEVNTVRPDLEDRLFRVRVVERVSTTDEGISLADARVVVGGGRGVGSGEGFESLDELAHLLGGAVGCSRAVTNHGWRSHAEQIGQTGTRIAPELYIACGVSGAIQHMVGCKGARNILVINTDPEAPIIARADFAVIGDLHEVVPALNEAVRQRHGD